MLSYSKALQGKGYDAVMCMLTDTIDTEVLDAAGMADTSSS